MSKLKTVKLQKKLQKGRLPKKLWLNIFIKISVVFVIFVAALCLANTVFLEKYYIHTNKKDLIAAAKTLQKADITNADETVELIGEIQSNQGFEVEIYDNNDRTLYSSSSEQMMSYLFAKGENQHLRMNHHPMKALEEKSYSDGSVLERAVEQFSGKEYYVYRTEIQNGCFAEVRVPVLTIRSSAKSANTFISCLALLFLALSLVWVLWFSKKISKPIAQMNTITKNMAALNFKEKLVPASKDEIGQLAFSINNLSQKLNETLMDLQQSNAQLRDEIELEHQLDVMRRGFVANVSHELKTPIAIIQGYAEGLKAGINENNREKYCDIIVDESKRMNKLVLSILNLSKYESGQIQLNLSAFNISEMAVMLAKRITAGKNLNLVTQVGQGLAAFADCDMIEQVLKSYLENAVSHVDPGGTVTVKVEQNNEYQLTVSVLNTGSHIEEELMPQIWQSFFRGDPAHNRESGRFGLGLSIVSAIIKLHKRECGVYNTEQGVCFWFSLSAAPKQSGPAEPPQS